MNYKRYNISILFVLAGVLIFTGVFNYFVNPFNVFPQNQSILNKKRPALKRQERLTKILTLMNARNCETVFVGTSRADFSLSEKYYEKITGKSALNLALEKSNFFEHYYMINQAIKYQPKLKTVLVELDFDFSYNLKESDISELNTYSSTKINNYISVLFSWDAIRASSKTLATSLMKNYNKGYLPDGTKIIFHNEKVERAFNKSLNQYKNTGINYLTKPDLHLLASMIRDLNNKGIEVIIYIHPLHTTVYETVKQNGAWDEVEQFKKALAEIHPFYDFYYPSVYSNEPISPDMKYFFEASHCTYLVGEKILDKIFLDKGDFGYLVRKDNVDILNKQHRKELEEWENKNPQLVERVHRIRENGLK